MLGRNFDFFPQIFKWLHSTGPAGALAGAHLATPSQAQPLPLPPASFASNGAVDRKADYVVLCDAVGGGGGGNTEHPKAIPQWI
jgi:hypothetical protein